MINIINYMAIPGLKGNILINGLLRTKQIIIDAVLKHYDLTLEQLCGKRGVMYISDARMVCMYLLRHHAGLTWFNIGATFNRDHTTGIHAVTTVADRLQVDDQTKHDVTAILAMI